MSEGFKDLIESFDKLANTGQLEKAFMKAVKKAANPYMIAARESYPIRSGLLKKSFGIYPLKNSPYGFFVGVNRKKKHAMLAHLFEGGVKGKIQPIGGIEKNILSNIDSIIAEAEKSLDVILSKL